MSDSVFAKANPAMPCAWAQEVKLKSEESVFLKGCIVAMRRNNWPGTSALAQESRALT